MDILVGIMLVMGAVIIIAGALAFVALADKDD